jgi:hypothetical protein
MSNKVRVSVYLSTDIWELALSGADKMTKVGPQKYSRPDFIEEAILEKCQRIGLFKPTNAGGKPMELSRPVFEREMTKAKSMKEVEPERAGYWDEYIQRLRRKFHG